MPRIKATRIQYQRSRPRYPSELPDAEWALIVGRCHALPIEPAPGDGYA